MKCRSCAVKIPGGNGSVFYGQIGIDGVQCEKCAVADYKRDNPFWDLPLINQRSNLAKLINKVQS